MSTGTTNKLIVESALFEAGHLTCRRVDALYRCDNRFNGIVRLTGIKAFRAIWNEGLEDSGKALVCAGALRAEVCGPSIDRSNERGVVVDAKERDETR